MQRLVDVGFAFKPKRSYASTTWETRLKQVRDFQLEHGHGHAKIPVNHPTLGSWVHSQRREYKNYLILMMLGLLIPRVGKRGLKS
jgi:hypothetical protein